MMTSNQELDLTLPDIEVKLDLTLIETNLNLTLNKLMSYIKDIYSKIETFSLKTTRFEEIKNEQQQSLKSQQKNIQNIRQLQQTVIKEVFTQSNDQKRLSRIQIIEKQISNIRDSLKDDPKPFSRGMSRGTRTQIQNKSQIRIRDINLNSREEERDRKTGSRVSRRRINNDIQDQGTNNPKGNKSFHTSNTRKAKGNNTQNNNQLTNQSEFSINTLDELNTSSPLSAFEKQLIDSKMKIKEELQSIIESKIEYFSANYNNRLETLQKKAKIIPRTDSKGMVVTNINNQSSAKERYSFKESDKEQQLLQEPQQISPDTMKFQYEQLKYLISEANSQLKKQELEQKQISKRSSDIQLKLDKNNQRTTAAIKYLDKNVDKLTLRLRQIDMLRSRSDLDDNEVSKDSKTRAERVSKISKLLGIGDVQLPGVKMQNRVEVMDSLIKNMQEEIKEIKNQMMRVYGKEGLWSKMEELNCSSRVRGPSIDSNILQKVNAKLTQLQTATDKLSLKYKTMSETVSEFPLKLLQLSSKMREQSEIREQRLMQLIKELINRALIDPFNNNFTSHLRKQIYIKFLQIKHEYSGILKQIQKKVEDRADKKQIEYINAKYETNMLELRSIVARKGDIDDIKKWNKFVEGKMKELFDMIKNNESAQFKLVQQHTLSIKKKQK